MLHPYTSSILNAILANIGRMETIGERIERLRKEAKIPAGALAKAAGVSLSAIRQLEKNESKNPRPETLLGIARKLGKTMEEIVDPGAAPVQAGQRTTISATAMQVAKWFDALSDKDKRKAIAQLLMSMDTVPDDYVEKFLPLPPTSKPRETAHAGDAARAKR